MLNRAKDILLNRNTKLPSGVGKGLLALNRNPRIVFGGPYNRYCRFLNKHRMFFDNRSQLIKSVHFAIESIPFYRKRYSGLRIESVEEFEEKIGFIDKDIVLKNYSDFMNPSISMDDYDTGTTGGTSGKPLTFIAPKKRYVVELATMHFLWERAGYHFNTRAVIRNHRLPKKRHYLINPLTREVIFDGFRLTHEHFESILSVMQKMGIRFIHCYPSTAYEFALYLRKNNTRPRIEAFLSGSENVFDYQRDLIEGELGIRFYNWYGHSEKLVLAGYCEGTNHYHAEPTYGYFELIDKNGNVVREPGKTGEIVGTSFHNPGMPFIRYRTDDFAEYVGDKCTTCGRRLPVFKNVRGRWSGDRIYNADGTFVTTTALNLHNKLYQVINGIQYLQRCKGELTILIVKSDYYTEEHEKALYAHFLARLNGHTSVRIRYTDRLERLPNGKFVHLISQVNSRSTLSEDSI